MQPLDRRIENKVHDCNKLGVTVVRWHGRTAELRACLDFFVTFCVKTKSKRSPMETKQETPDINPLILQLLNHSTSHVKSKIQSYPYTTIHILKTGFAKKPKHPV